MSNTWQEFEDAFVEAAKGGVLYLKGHTYACDDCKKAAREAGIIGIEIIP